ncbi:MAG TPA: tetratricopeptide repeat protein [archaeon]|nr:tetratricopeptide repeat protein [archaeon]
MLHRTGKIRIALLLAILLLDSALRTGVSLAAEQLDNQMYLNLRNISLALERSGRLEEAAQILINHRDDPRILKLLENLFDKAGKKEDFLPLAEEAARNNPESPEVLSIYLKSLNDVGLKDSLRLTALRFLERDPEKNDRYIFTGNQLRRYRMFEEALSIYEQGRKKLKGPTLFSREVTELLIDLARYSQALDELLVFLSGQPKDLPFVQHQVYRILEAGEKEKELVLERLSQALKDTKEPVRNGLLVLLVDANLTLGRPQPAFMLLRELLSFLDNNGAYRQLIVFIGRSLKLKEYEPALWAYDLADSLGLIAKGRALLGKADILLSMGDLSRAESSLLELTEAPRENEGLRVEAMNRLGGLYLEKLGLPDKALQIYRELEKIDRTRGQTLLGVKLKIVESFIRLQQLDEARKLNEELLAGTEDPETRSRALLLLGHTFFYAGQSDSAVAAYNAFAKLRLGEPEANDAIGRIYLIQNDKSPDARVNKQVGSALHKAECGELQQAAALFQNILREVADSSYMVQILYQMGRVYEGAEEFSLALGVYDEMLKKFPSHHLAPLAELRMGVIFLQQVGDTETARKHLERVVYEYPVGVATPPARRLLRSLENNKL